MRERQFIEQNREKWKEFESLVNQKESDPEKLGKLFVQITDDLSYARTFYPNRSVRVYLNKLAQSVFDKLYKSRKRKKNKFVGFFTDEIPSAVYYAKRELTISLIIFVISLAAGVFSAIQDPDFTKSILSEHYVEMTQENIEKNDQMAVYKGDNQWSMFLYIARKNLRIDFLTYISGLTFGLWAIVMLVYNGIMVGVFQFFFVQNGDFTDSFLTIWMHGAFEMSAAVIVGGAGLILGRGMVFPGTYSRLQSLMIAAKQSLKIFLIAISMTILAAFVESFITRYTGMHNIVRLFWIALSFGFVGGYFIVLPYIKSKRGTILPKPVEKLQEDLNFKIELDEPKSVSKLFSDGFSIYRKTINNYLPIIAITSLIFAAVNIIFTYDYIFENFNFYVEPPAYVTNSLGAIILYWITYPITWTYTNLGVVFSLEVIDFRLLFNTIVLVIAFAFSYYSFGRVLHSQKLRTQPDKQDLFKAIGFGFILAIIVLGSAFFPSTWLWLLILTPMPYIILLLSSMQKTGNVNKINIMTTKFWSSYGLYLCLGLICTIVFTLLTFVVFRTFFTFANMLLKLEGVDSNKIFVGVYIFFSCFALLFVLPPLIYGFEMVYFSNRENLTANGLKSKLSFLTNKED